MTTVSIPASLTEPQLAALAKVACGSEAEGGIVLLVGPAGVGVSTVLEAWRATQPSAVSPQSLAEWLSLPPLSLPAVVVLDDAHLETELDLARLLAHTRQRSPSAVLILAGQGRLLTLVARDTRLEQAIRIRVALLPGSLSDSQSLVTAALAAGARLTAEALSAVHETAGGLPASVIRLAELANVVAAARPDGSVTAADIEALHRRLSPLAA